MAAVAQTLPLTGSVQQSRPVGQHEAARPPAAYLTLARFNRRASSVIEKCCIMSDTIRSSILFRSISTLPLQYRRLRNPVVDHISRRKFCFVDLETAHARFVDNLELLDLIEPLKQRMFPRFHPINEPL
jgi:hypothetical protein